MKFIRIRPALFTPEDNGCYNTNKQHEKKGNWVEEDATMTQLLERIEKYNIPPQVAQQLGLDKDWKKSVSREFLQHVLSSIHKYENVLKKLSDK